ncbi:MAG TPA: DUF4124 domain-containing protein [Gammaproteobacteria bacterium]|nr:DUF4124 domain-containing protein [Gammaproteobacteria bacterium]
MRYLLLVVLSLLAGVAQAEIYKCVVDGRTVFADRPCAANAARVELKVHRPRADEASQAAGNTRWIEATLDEKRDARRRRALLRDIRDAEDEIVDLQRAMDKEQEALKTKKRNANNNLAGATWEESISTEMRAVTSRYVAKIDFVKDRLTRYRAELDRLGN